MKTLLLLASCLCAIHAVSADTIILKNGEKIDGKVLREDGDDYVVEVKVSTTIRDEKRIPRGDVKVIEKMSPDMKAFGKIEGFVPTPELLDAAGYESRIEMIQGFIAEHAKSPNVSKAEEMLVALDAELEVVRAGGIKYGEEMVAAEDYMANAYEYDAMIAAKKIKEAVGRREFLSALRLFAEYDKTFADAAGHAETVSLIKQVLSVYIASIEESLASYDSRMEKRTAGLAQMSLEDRANTERALAEQQERLAEKYTEENAASGKWVTPDAFYKQSLDTARLQAETEMKRLEALPSPTALEVPIEETYRVAWGNLTSGTAEEKKANLEGLKTARMPEKYLEMLHERAGIDAGN